MKIEGWVGEAEPLTPGLDEQRDQLPLRAAGVLELVDEHVVVARLEPVAALRELVHLAQQVERALEDVGEIQHRPLVEGAAVLRERDAEHAPDAARHDGVEVARERRHDALDRRAELRDRGAMAPRRLGGRIVVGLVGMERAGRAGRPSAVRKCAATRSSNARICESDGSSSAAMRRTSRTSSWKRG